MKRPWYVILLFLALFSGCTDSADVHEQQLCEAEEKNRTDVPLVPDSIHPLVEYYDGWQYRLRNLFDLSDVMNHRMRAYYMLGCAYRDAGEAPAAIHYYNIAIEQADTLNPDCDYATLLRIYGQMSVIFNQQNMPEEELTSCKAVGKYALLIGDTLTHILSIERQVGAYYELADTCMVLKTTEEARRLYLELGNRERAAQVFPTAILVSLENGNYPRACKFMDIFERESGIFNAEGNIETGREVYYYSQGLYYLGTDQMDAAEKTFRKLLSHGYTYEAHKGLLSVYQKKKMTDSIVKYANLSEVSLLSWMESRQTESIIQSSSLYKYERAQNLAERKVSEAKVSHFINFILFLFGLLLSLIAYLGRNHLIQKNLEKELENQKLVKEYMSMRMEYQQQKEQLLQLQNEYQFLLHENTDKTDDNGQQKQQELTALEEKINALNTVINNHREKVLRDEESLISEDIVIQFRDMSIMKLNGRKATKKDWDQLLRVYKRHMPHMFAQLQVTDLSSQELRIAVLSHLNFSTSEIVVLLNTTKSTVSNTKLRINNKVFHDASAQTLVSNLKRYAYFQTSVSG